MASTHRAPKQWCLSKVETINSFEIWKQNLLYTLSLDSNFAPFLVDGFTWLKKTKARQALDGLLTALHIQLSHKSCHQLKMVVKRYLFALDLDKAVSRVSDGCHSCAALRNSPTARIDQSTSPPPDAIGWSFAADVIKRSRQLIFVLRKTVTS